MQGNGIERRQVLRLLGAGVLLGSVTGTVSADEGKYIVGTSSRAARREAQRQARSVYRVLDFGSFGSAVAGQFSDQALRGLSRHSGVDYIEPDGRMYAIAIEGGSAELDSSWGVDRIDAEKAHATHTGAGAKIAILDTGIDYTHSDLSDNYVGGYDFVNDDSDPMDDHGHGSHCAGIAAARRGDGGVLGVAPDASLYGVKVLAADGSGSYSDIAAGLDWTVANGMHVASMSLGGKIGSSTIERACNNAEANGVFVVAAAGNDGAGRVSYPAKYDSVVAVSASNKSDSIAWFSNTGSDIELAAPGVNVTSTVPLALDTEDGTQDGYATWSGTSMACPHVAGAAGLLMADGSYDNAGARSRLHATAEDLGPAGRDKEYGYGLVDAEAAVGSSSGDDGGSSLAVTTDGATAGETTATLNGTVSGLADGASATAYFEWGTTSGALDQKTADQSVGNQSFSAELSGLTSGTTYYFRAVATDGSTTVYGEELSFTTTSSGGNDTTDPSGTIDGVTEASTNNPHAEYAVDWTASDDVELKEVTVELRRNGSAVVDSVPTAVSGTGPVSGTTEVSEKFGSRNGYTYEVRLVVTDAADNVYQSTWQAAP